MEPTDFGVFVSQGRPSGTHTQMTFFCQNLDAQMADLRAHGVSWTSSTCREPRSKTASMTGMASGAWFRDPEGNLLAVAERPDDFLS
jgi:hypothetical protein